MLDAGQPPANPGAYFLKGAKRTRPISASQNNKISSNYYKVVDVQFGGPAPYVRKGGDRNTLLRYIG